MTPAENTLFLTRFNQVVTVDKQFAQDKSDKLGVIPDGAIGIRSGNIFWVGPSHQIPPQFQGARQMDCSGHIALPGLIDSHTHPVFAGNRADEFEARMRGDTYLDIAKRGGGILKTVYSTRNASEDELLRLSKERLLTALSFGVTTIEAKSGYGLTVEDELKSLRVLKRLKNELPMTVIPTFMGAHDIPPEYKTNPEAYVDLVCDVMIPEVAKQQLALYCDVFCETGYFTVEQSKRILEQGLQYGLKPRIHAEEFSNLEGAAMAASLGALSADHLLHLSEAGIQALAQSNTVATVLPGTAFYLKIKDYAPARQLLDAGACVAIATDSNPGSCMSQNLQLMMVLGCLQMNMLPHEAIQAVTIHAAKALALEADRGSLTPGKRADLALFDVTTYNELLYHYGVNHLRQVWIKGQCAWDQLPEKSLTFV